VSRRLGVTLLEIVLAVLVVGLLVWCFLLQKKVAMVDTYLGAPTGLVTWAESTSVQQRRLNGLHGAQLEFLCGKWLANRPRGDTSVCPTQGPPVTEIPPQPPCYPPKGNCPH
jgi:hypothetical protein